VYALVVPTSYVVHVPAPNTEPHVQEHNAVTTGSEIFVLIVFLMVAGRVILRIYHSAVRPSAHSPN
jgi:hypothetical protein